MNESKELADPKVRIGQVFVSSVTFEHRGDALELSPKTDLGNLGFGVHLEVGGPVSGDKGYVLIRLETKKENNPLYHIRVEMIGVVSQGLDAEKFTARDYLISSGAFMMYPFMREFIANLTARGRFGPVWIRPLNFKQLADEMQKKVDQEQATTVKAD